MPPAKKEQVPAVTIATIAAGLAAAEPTQKQAALLQLAAAGPDFSTPQVVADVLQHQIPAKVTEALQLSADKSVKLLACRQLAVYAAASHKHPLQQAVGTLHTTQVSCLGGVHLGLRVPSQDCLPGTVHMSTHIANVRCHPTVTHVVLLIPGAVVSTGGVC
jgi:hypothetical protein